MTESQHSAAPPHLPWFITAPGQTDILYVITTLVVILTVVALGVLFFRLHSLPERMGHKKLQFEVVAVLGLLSLFTHNHAFWVAGLLLALVDLPDFVTPLKRMAGALETISGVESPRTEEAVNQPPSRLAVQSPEPNPWLEGVRRQAKMTSNRVIESVTHALQMLLASEEDKTRSKALADDLRTGETKNADKTSQVENVAQNTRDKEASQVPLASEAVHSTPATDEVKTGQIQNADSTKQLGSVARDAKDKEA